MSVAANEIDPLLGGFYTVGEAARLLRIDNRQRIYRWLRSGDDACEAVIARDYDPISKSQELSFWDLIEIRFVEHFRSQGLSLQYLRKVAEVARKKFKTLHPFALSNAEYLTDRRKIFEQFSENEGIRIRELLSGQYEMYDAIETVLAKGVAFDAKTSLAEEWRPLQNDCPNVVVNPRYAYGKPVMGDSRVPTDAIYRQWRAEKGDRKRVAAWWGVSGAEVDEAIEFEIRMAA
ncbi:MAG: helix-turn-helix domain-containing protein [Proteobacteria bacterium]|nr:helix-turn-helix domain-containing protein [Pseudomonadota bacterium]